MSPLPWMWALSTVHPRVRGEHSSRCFRRISTAGSSPRSRGTWNNEQPLTGTRRFIPAFAGNMRLTGGIVCPYTVHPRVRGEHISLVCHAIPASGSSPRSRGTCRPRIVGGTRPPVHPRVRGEHVLLGEAEDDRLRFIPAFAGNILLITYCFI